MEKKLYLCERNRKRISTMAQETLESLIQVMFTLSLSDQKKVIERMQAHLGYISQETPFTKEEIDARLDESEQDIANGRYSTTQEVFHPQYAVAV